MISDAKLNLSPSNDEFNPATNDQNKQTKEGISMFNMCYEILSIKIQFTILDNSILTENFENAYLEQKDACESNSNALADARIIELQKIFEEKEQTYHKEKCTLKSQVSNLFYLIFALLC